MKITPRAVRLRSLAVQEQFQTSSSRFQKTNGHSSEKLIAFKDTYQSFQLDQLDDPGAKALSKAMQPLIDWAGEDNERQMQAYSVGLRAAALAVGGPTSSVLHVEKAPSEVKNEISKAASALNSITRKAPKESTQMLELMVPNKWKREGVTGDPDRAALNRTAIAAEAGRYDLFPHLDKISEPDQPFDLEKLSERVAHNASTSEKFEEKYQEWEPAEAWSGTWNDSQVALLVSRDYRLEIHQGKVVRATRGAYFSLDSEPERIFNRNYVEGIRTMPRD